VWSVAAMAVGLLNHWNEKLKARKERQQPKPPPAKA
jgi:hypothetical protein